MKVFKYELTASKTMLQLPHGADLLSVQMQFNTPVLWALVDPKKQLKETRVIAIIPTGVEFDADGASYIATFQTDGGRLIFHAFEIGY